MGIVNDHRERLPSVDELHPSRRSGQLGRQRGQFAPFKTKSRGHAKSRDGIIDIHLANQGGLELLTVHFKLRAVFFQGYL